MEYFYGYVADIIGFGYIFFPGEVWLFIISVVLTLALIWFVEKL